MDALKTLSIMMYLATFLPDWNSLDEVRLAHSHLELSSIIFFGLLAVAEAVAHRMKEGSAKYTLDTFGIAFFVIAVLCEGGAYPYSQRNDELSGHVIDSLSGETRQAEINAHSALVESANAKTAADTAKRSAGGAVIKADKAKASALTAAPAADRAVSDFHEADRRLNEQGPRADVLVSKVREMRVALLPFAGQKVDVKVLETARPETYQLLSLVEAELAISCHWELRFKDSPHQIPGMMVLISEDANARTREAAGALGRFLVGAGLITSRPVETESVNSSDRISPDVIELWIGEHN